MRHPGRAPSAAGGTMVRDKPGLRVPPPPASATRSAEWRQTQRCRWGCPRHAAGPAQRKVTLTWPRPSAPFPTPPGSPCSLLPSLDHSRSHSHSEDHLRPLLLSFPDPWTWAQPHSAHLPQAKAPDQVPAAMPSPVRTMPTSTTTAPMPSLSSPPLTFTYHPPFKTTCPGKLKFKKEHSTATLGTARRSLGRQVTGGPSDPAAPLLGVCPREPRTPVHTDTCPQWLPAVASQRSQARTHAMTGRNRESMMLREESPKATRDTAPFV